MAHWFRPPKYLLLRCIEKALETFTSLIDFSVVIDKIRDRVDVELAHFVPRRRLDSKLNILRLKKTGFIDGVLFL